MTVGVPAAYVVLGDVDYWSTLLRGATMAYDSTLRRAMLFTGSSWATICGVSTRRCGQVPIYAEAIVPNHPNTMFGLVADSLAASVLNTWLAQTTNAAAMRETFVYHNNAIVQSGLAAYGGAIRAGVKLYYDGTTPKAQFYKNGVTYGAAVTLAADTTFRLAFSATNTNVEATLLLDAPDMLHLPSDCQPWGASVRTSESGGYSPAAMVFSASAVAFSLDSYGRTTSGTTTTGGISICNSAPNLTLRLGIYYCEFVIETDTGNLGLLGLVRRGTGVSAINYPGAVGASFGYYYHNGSKYTAAAPTAYGAAAAAGQRIGMFWEPRSGKVWWSLDGVVQASGDPLAGTNAAFTTAIGDYVPAVTPYQGRVRLCPHALEQLHRPGYAIAWDGDVLPEQHYDGLLLEPPEYERSIYLPLLWGGNKPKTSTTVEVANGDGRYDALSMYALRNQMAMLFALDDYGTPLREATMLCDRAELNGELSVRVVLTSLTDKLLTRVNHPLLSIGVCTYVPALARQNASLTYDVCQTHLNNFQFVRDGGLAVDTFCRVPVATNDPAQPFAVKRTVAPSRKHAVAELCTYRQTGSVALANGALNAWTGSTPDSWSKAEVGGGAVTSAGGTAARMQGGGVSGNYCRITQQVTSGWTGGSAPNSTRKLFIGLHLTANASGDLEVALEGSAGAYAAGVSGTYSVKAAKVSTAGTGWIWVPIDDYFQFGAPTLNYVSVYTSRTVGSAVDITVNEVTIVEALPTDGTYLLETLGGLSSTAYTNVNEVLRTLIQPQDLFVNLAIAPYWTDARPTLADLLDRSFASVFGDYYVDSHGVITGVLFQFEPQAVATSDASYRGTLVDADAVSGSEVQIRDDNAPGLSDRCLYNTNFAPHTDTDLQTSVSASLRAELQAVAQEQKLAVVSPPDATQALPFHSFVAAAVGAPPVQRSTRGTLATGAPYSNSTKYVGNATANPDPSGTPDARQIALHRGYCVRRRFIQRDYLAASVTALRIAPSSVVNVVMPRFGLAAGRQMLVVGYKRRLGDPAVTLTFWG